MCIAIANPEGKGISRETLKNCWDINPHGAGFAVSKNGAVEIHKGFMKFDDFYSKWQEFKGLSSIIHFRIKTHGSIKPDNCHPFKVNDSLVFIHNGIISDVTDRLLEDEVDTQAFNRLVLQKLPPNFYKDGAMLELISGYVGGSKLVFLDSAGKITIVNADRGEWNNGIWYSNGSYKSKPKVVPISKNTIKNTDALAVDDWVKLTREVHVPVFGASDGKFYKKKKGDLGLITGFNQYGHAVVLLEDDIEYLITHYSVEKVYFELFDGPSVDDYYNQYKEVQ